ncbi:hypothetical protein NQ315_013624, partial [Exocentrus adspersus]
IFLSVLIFGNFVTGTCAAQVAAEPKEKTVLPGDSATFLCRVAVPLQYCRIEIPGFKTYNLNKGSVDNDVSYFGKGLDFGECGVTIQSAQERNNGIVKCTLGIPSEFTESIETMQLTVARAPRQPELDLRGGADSLGVYKINDVLEASCIVSDGRPVANLSWFLGEEPIPDNELTMPTDMTLAKDNLHSRIQNLTRTLRASDNGKFLRCVAEHPAYPGGKAETRRQLDIKFAPLPIYDSLDKFGYQIGKMGLINVTIEANPQPQIEWDIGGQKIREGSTDNTGRIEAEQVYNLGQGKYVANLRIAAVKKEDTEVDYILTAHNSYGLQEYKFRISTNPEPEAVDLGIGAIIGIVAAILFLLLLVFVLVFAKLTGRWCFSGNSDHRNLGESSDTESADVRPRETKKTIPPIKFTSIFKKNKDKVSSEDEPDTRHMETEEDKSLPVEEEINTTPATEVEPKEGLVYAELDLVRADMKPVVKNDEKTEYAEIVYTPATNEKEKDKGTESESSDK